MIDVAFIQTMARYNKWQNESLYRAADGIGVEARMLDRGAFFGSIHKTLSHLLWGDQIWMSRFSESAGPAVPSISESVDMIKDWETLKSGRKEMDGFILGWAGEVTQDFLDDDLTWYSGAAGREVSKPVGMLVTHMFNHQTHHRGQVHAMLTAAGAKPDDTDLFMMP